MDFGDKAQRKYLCFARSGRIPELDEMSAEGWIQHHAATAEKARSLISAHDYRVGVFIGERGEVSAVDMLQTLQRMNRYMRWIVLMHPACIEDQQMINFISDCCYDFHTLPLNRGYFLVTLGHAHGMAELSVFAALHKSRRITSHGMVGRSPAMRRLYADLDKVGPINAPVLITGESGTGKELAARAIYATSNHASGPCIEVNCGALPVGIIQSELFGHEKGAFTGASQRKVGKIEAADGGVLFLDEIGDLPLEQQTNLLRFLQEGTIERIGSNQKVKVDVRIIAATHLDLEKAVKDGRFREDLYYRLNVLRISTPALRERGRDIEELAHFFLDLYKYESSSPVNGFTPGALKAMICHSWPGNVRELINRVRRAVVMSESKVLTELDLGLQLQEKSGSTLVTAREEAERGAIERALVLSRGNISCAANILKVSRRNLYRLMEKHGFDDSPAKPLIFNPPNRPSFNI